MCRWVLGLHEKGEGTRDGEEKLQYVKASQNANVSRDSSRICDPSKTAACRINDLRQTDASGEEKKWQQDNQMKKYAPQKLQESRTQPKIL